MWGAVGLVLAIPIIGGLKIVFDHIKPLKPYAAWLGYEEIPSDSERRRR
jgi:predicted PurR-regulated permease PerM